MRVGDAAPCPRQHRHRRLVTVGPSRPGIPLRARFPLVVILLASAIPAACRPVVPASVAPLPASPVEGVVTHVESTALNAVSSFDLRLADGTVLRFAVGPLDNGDAFPPGHLTEHQAFAEKVRVFFRADGRALIATRLEDAAP